MKTPWIWFAATAPLAVMPAGMSHASEEFEKHVRPLLVEKCLSCHGAEKQKAGLRLDTAAGWKTGGESGPAIVPGQPGQSLLIKALNGSDGIKLMPPKGKLGDRDIALLTRWVAGGAADPREGPATTAKADNWPAEFRKRLDWWSLKPLRPVAEPPPADDGWGSDPIDRFIGKALGSAGLKPAPPADPAVLLRRLSFVLTGLPPAASTSARFEESLARDPQAAYGRLVDELLASPHFGERFARHWMDVVRYTDTYGYEWDNPAKGSHEYRDYLIRAFNADLPYDRFLREQVAGDLMAEPRVNRGQGINESLIGPMFFHMGEHRHGSSLEFNGVHQEMVNNKVDAFSKAFLAMTVACSRCHDHKLEAVSQRDYYALGAVFMTPRWTSRVVDAPGKNDKAISRLSGLRSEIRAAMAGEWRRVAGGPEGWPAGRWKTALPDKPSIEDISYPLKRLNSPGDMRDHWAALAAQWRTERDRRAAQNKGFTILADFERPGFPSGWLAEGDGLKSGYVDDGTPLISLRADEVFSRLLPRGYHTHALSSKLPGSLRMPPDDRVPGRNVSLRLAGGEFGGHLEVHENAFQGEQIRFLKNIEPAWVSFADKAPVNGINRFTREFATASLNPNFPPRTGLAGGLPNNDFGHDKRSWISITGIVAHDAGAAPADNLEAFAQLYAGEPPATSADVARKVDAWLGGAVLRWCAGTPRPGDGQVVNWLLSAKLLPNRAEAGTPLARLLAEYREVENSIEFARTVNGMDEREWAKAGLAFNARGNVDSVGPAVSPDFLSMFAGGHSVAAAAGSGRMELADSLLRPDHPLTARVYANRLWHWIMGSGIVATPDDFGRLGGRPSHPELLDHLANLLIREGWSTKRFVRRLLLTETFRQSGLATEAARARDPANLLRHHYPMRRLEAEAVRDSMLAVSGRLDPTLHGRPILPHRVAEDGAKRLYSGPLDGNGRRSIYLQISIMEPPKFLVGFNLPDPRLPTGRRDETNVPAQALILLNDPFVEQMARHWGKALVKAPHASPEDRVRDMFASAFSRVPDEAELRRWSDAANGFKSTGGSGLMEDEAAWTRLAHALFNTKEFLYYR